MTREPTGLSFRLFGIPVRIQPAFLLVAVVLGSGGPFDFTAIAVWVGVLTVSILWHELGHALAFRAYGYRSSIELYGFGGFTQADEPYDSAERPGRDILISLAGPAAGLLLGAVGVAVAGAIEPATPYVDYAFRVFGWVNVGWTLINLAPVLPLDGGRVMASILRVVFRGKERNAAYGISVVVASAGGTWAYLVDELWITAVAAFLTFVNLRVFLGTRPSPDAVAGRPGWLANVFASLEKGDRKRAMRVARSRLETFGARRPTAAFVVVWVHLLEGRSREAAAVADLYLTEAIVTGALEPPVVASAGGRDRAVELWRRAFDEQPTQAMGGLLAQALIEAELFDEAVRLLADPRLDPVSALTGRRVQIALIKSDRIAEALEVGHRLLAIHRNDALTTYNMACCHARLEHPDEALEWLDRAVDRGFTQGEHLDSDPDLDALRDRPAFVRIREKAGV